MIYNDLKRFEIMWNDAKWCSKGFEKGFMGQNNEF